MAKVVILTGAGVSAPSGVPTFRTATSAGQALWHGHDINEVCSILTWKRNFEKVHDFYSKRRSELAKVEPNAAHRAIAEWQRRYDSVFLVTTNVDDLHERAGSSQVLHVHGNLASLRCVACGHIWNIGYRSWDCEAETCPRCPSRKGVRPNVVFFDELAPLYRRLHDALGIKPNRISQYGSAPPYRLTDKAQDRLKPEDTLISIGASGTVVGIGHMAAILGCHRIFNALEPTPHDPGQENPVPPDSFDRFLYMSCEQAVDLIDRILRERLG